MDEIEKYFEKYRKNTIGNNTEYNTIFGKKKLIYADWVASGRLYLPIEEKLIEKFGPFVANTHTETSETGMLMTKSYHYAQEIIKKHVNASADDVLIHAGFGMTSAVNKFQRILGLRLKGRKKEDIPENERPVVFISHMEHHSNHTSWLTTIADVVIIPPKDDLTFSTENLEKTIAKYNNRKFKIGAFTAASNVTGIELPVHKIAKIMHQNEGVCFVDYAMSAPYVEINMHPQDPMEKLDAIMFSPHKFLGGPGASGVLIFDKTLYNNEIPDNPGGGTVDWTNAWNEYKFIDNIEAREDGGTPGFLQAIKTALAIKLKEEMTPQKIKEREEEQLKIIFDRFNKIKGLKILAGNVTKRLGAVSFYHNDIHYNFIVRVLSDKYGIQVRGGCACAGTYGHLLLGVDKEESKRITEKINKGDLSEKPGWVRLSIHPTMTDKEIIYIADAIEEIVNDYQKLQNEYIYSPKTNDFFHKNHKQFIDYKEWFSMD